MFRVKNIIKNKNNIHKIFIRNFKRPVSNSDLDSELNKKLFNKAKNKNKFDVENKKWTEDDNDLSGKDLYHPKYGSSHYESQEYQFFDY